MSEQAESILEQTLDAFAKRVEAYEKQIAELKESRDNWKEAWGTEWSKNEVLEGRLARLEALREALWQRIYRREYLGAMRAEMGEELYAKVCKLVAEEMTDVLREVGMTL